MNYNMSYDESESEKFDITGMLSEINNVLHEHLTNILSPMVNERKNTKNVLLNIPFVKKLYIENVNLYEQEGEEEVEEEGEEVEVEEEEEVEEEVEEERES